MLPSEAFLPHTQSFIRNPILEIQLQPDRIFFPYGHHSIAWNEFKAYEEKNKKAEKTRQAWFKKFPDIYWTMPPIMPAVLSEFPKFRFMLKKNYPLGFDRNHPFGDPEMRVVSFREQWELGCARERENNIERFLREWVDYVLVEKDLDK